MRPERLPSPDERSRRLVGWVSTRSAAHTPGSCQVERRRSAGPRSQTGSERGRRLSESLQGKGAFRRFRNQVYERHPELISVWQAMRCPGQSPGRPMAGEEGLSTKKPLNGSPATTRSPTCRETQCRRCCRGPAAAGLRASHRRLTGVCVSHTADKWFVTLLRSAACERTTRRCPPAQRSVRRAHR